MYLPFTSVSEVVAVLQATPEAARQPLWLLCLADCHGDSVPALLAALRDAGMRACGGIFPGLIVAGERRDCGLIARPLPAQSQAAIADLDPAGVEWRQPLPPPPESGAACSLILVDCLAPGIAGLLEAIYDRYGHRFPYVGAGAGYHDLRSAPSVFTEAGLIARGGLLVQTTWRATVQVRHGWRRVSGPFIATRTRGNVIQEFNWEPAGSFYRTQVEALAPALAGRPVFPDLGAHYPLSIGKEGGEDVMRDPMMVNSDDELVVLSDVPENAVMYLAHGDQESLIGAAQQAVEACGTPDDVDACFIADCFSRALMLGEDFPRELAGISGALARFTEVPAEGVLALGEIAANGRHSLEFFNKTMVLALGHR